MRHEERKKQTCHIRVEGELDPSWKDWFGGLTITRAENGHTDLEGPFHDQSALHGLLIKIRDLGLPLVSVYVVGKEDQEVRT